MPGLLAMDQQPSAIAPDIVKNENGSSDAAHGATHLVNGTNGVKSGHTTNDAAPVINGDESGKARPGSILPPLDDSWRKSAANVSFGKMLERMGQGCYADLSELVTKLNDIPPSDVAVQTNGVRIPAGVDTDPMSLKKKRLMMEFASTWRERFIKARIISDWARSSGVDVAKIIDLRNTLMERDLRIHEGIEALLKLKVDSLGLRMPEPNIRGAIQYLSTGKSTYPDLGFVKPKPLEASQILDLTNEMGVQASLRIWLNEIELPYYMADYAVANGRVTWRTPGEFEVDLACIDQDPAKSPWYFVDLRFLFSPTPAIAEDTRPHLEAQINAATASKGLQGCYDFCHNYVLDYRIAELESQAYALARDRWFDSLRIERHRRIMTVQYWTNRGGKKSWIELGVHSGKGQHPAHWPVTPVNYCRWFLDGKLLQDIELDWSSLDIGKILIDVQRRHAASVLDALTQGLADQVVPEQMLKVQLKKDTNRNPELSLSLPSAHPACTKEINIGIALITGKWFIAPQVQRAKSLEASIASAPDSFTPAVLERFVCNIMQEGVDFEAQRRGWRRVCLMHAENQRNFKTLFPAAYEVSIWRTSDPRRDWPRGWAVAYSTSLDTVQWWVVQFVSTDAAFTITSATELLLSTRPWNEGLRHVEEQGLVKVQSIVLQSTPKISYSCERYEPQNVPSTPQADEAYVYLVSTGDLLRTDGSPNERRDHTWALSPIRISSGKLLRRTWSLQHDLRISIRPGRLSQLRQYLSTHSIPGMQMNDTNGIALRFEVDPGEALSTPVQKLLQDLTRLNRCLRNAAMAGLRCSKLALDRLVFSYGSQDFTVEVLSSSMHLILKPEESNPHQRIHESLERILAEDNDDDAFARMTLLLVSTLPLLMTIDRLESRENPALFYLHVKSGLEYLLQYTGVPTIAFRIHGRLIAQGMHQGLRWHLEQEQQSRTQGPISDDFAKALQDFWTEPGPEHQSLKTALVTSDRGIAVAVEKLHSIVMRFVMPAQPIVPPSKGSKDEQAATEGQSKTQPDVIMLD